MTATMRIFTIGALTLLCLVLCPSICSFAQQPSLPTDSPSQDSQFSVVTGQVLDASTGGPLRKARIVLINEDNDRADPYISATDSDGRFVIEGIKPGRYEINIERDGYVSASYSEDESEKSPAIVSLKSGQRLSDLVFDLQKCGVIAGRVMDEDGQPAQGVTVEALQRDNFLGKVRTYPAAQVSTNDLGEFRIFGLRPGRYFVQASPESGAYRSVGNVRLKRQTFDSAGGYVSVYYPNASDISRASLIHVKPGDEITGIDLTFVETRSYKVHGQILNVAIEQPSGDTSVALVPREADSYSTENARPGQVDQKTGVFEIDDAPPGSYTVIASYRDHENDLIGSVPLEIANADVDTVRVVITRGAEVRGRVIQEGKVTASPTVSVDFQLRDSQSLGYSRSTETNSDGTFSAKGLKDGIYDLSVASRCDTCYLKSATANGVDVLEIGLQVASGSAPSPIEIVYSSNSSTVDGTVTRQDGTPAAGATIVLVSDHPQHIFWQSYLDDSTDQNGNFIIGRVPPGSYHAYAWQKIERYSYMDPDFLKSFTQRAQAFSIGENQKKTLQVTLLSLKPEAH
jgi:5-hydroxyisourate hydrolase-like protein (transthyretin family)